MDDMQRQIEERKTQAMEQGILEKAICVAYYLGDGYRDRQVHHSQDTRVTYSSSAVAVGLTIVFTRSVHNDSDRPSTYETLEVLEGEETVFLCKGGTIEGYIPGDWEAELDNLQQPADRAKEEMVRVAEQKQQTTESERATALRKAWGLSDKDGRFRGTDDPKPRLVGVVERPPRRRR